MCQKGLLGPQICLSRSSKYLRSGNKPVLLEAIWVPISSYIWQFFSQLTPISLTRFNTEYYPLSLIFYFFKVIYHIRLICVMRCWQWSWHICTAIKVIFIQYSMVTGIWFIVIQELYIPKWTTTNGIPVNLNAMFRFVHTRNTAQCVPHNAYLHCNTIYKLRYQIACPTLGWWCQCCTATLFDLQVLYSMLRRVTLWHTLSQAYSRFLELYSSSSWYFWNLSVDILRRKPKL